MSEFNSEAADPLDSGGVAKVVLIIINNDHLKKDLNTKGYIQVKKYSWERMARQTLDAYDKALSL